MWHLLRWKRVCISLLTVLKIQYYTSRVWWPSTISALLNTFLIVMATRNPNRTLILAVTLEVMPGKISKKRMSRSWVAAEEYLGSLMVSGEIFRVINRAQFMLLTKKNHIKWCKNTGNKQSERYSIKCSIWSHLQMDCFHHTSQRMLLISWILEQALGPVDWTKLEGLELVQAYRQWDRLHPNFSIPISNQTMSSKLF